jgi:hypothetical protein
MCAGVGSLRERAGMEERFREFEARLARAERRDRATRWSGLVLLLTTLAFMGARPATPQDKDGLKPARFFAVEIQKPPRAPHALTIRLPGTGRAIGLYPSPTALDPRTYFNDAGMLYTNGWIVISGVYSGTGEGFNIEHPTKDNSMLAIWSDVHGPAIQVRAANAGPESYLFQGLDRKANYTFSVEQNGGLRWGAASRADMDTNLYRSASRTLQTDGSLSVRDRLRVGVPGTASTFHVGGSLSLQRTAVHADYTLTDTDHYVGVTSTAARRTISLSTAAGKGGRVCVIKDETGGAGGQPIAVQARPGETIDGRSALTISTGYGVLRLISNGSNWFRM